MDRDQAAIGHSIVETADCKDRERSGPEAEPHVAEIRLGRLVERRKARVNATA